MDDELDEVIRSKPFELSAAEYAEAITEIKRSAFSAAFQWAEAAVMLVLLVLCTVNWCRNRFDYIWLALMIVCAALLVCVWAVPYMTVRSMAKKLARRGTLEAEVEPDWVALRRGTGEWLIALDETTSIRETRHLFLLQEENHHTAILRKDAFDDPDAVRAVLTAHTVVIKSRKKW